MTYPAQHNARSSKVDGENGKGGDLSPLTPAPLRGEGVAERAHRDSKVRRREPAAPSAQRHLAPHCGVHVVSPNEPPKAPDAEKNAVLITKARRASSRLKGERAGVKGEAAPDRSSHFENPAGEFAAGSLLLWQLADSAFPTGGFAHSGGLEAAWQNGEVRNRTELREWLTASLRQVSRAALPFVNTAHASPERLQEFDQICDAFTSNHVANRASRLQGRAFLTAVERIFQSENRKLNAEILPPPFAHLAPVHGACLRWLGVPGETAVRLFVFTHLRGLIAAAVRLNIVGPMEGQRIQFELSGEAESAAEQGASLTLEDLSQSAPLLDLWQGTQDRLYSRLFQS